MLNQLFVRICQKEEKNSCNFGNRLNKFLSVLLLTGASGFHYLEIKIMEMKCGIKIYHYCELELIVISSHMFKVKLFH